MILILACINPLTTCESDSNSYVSEQAYEYRIEQANLCSDYFQCHMPKHGGYHPISRHIFKREQPNKAFDIVKEKLLGYPECEEVGPKCHPLESEKPRLETEAWRRSGTPDPLIRHIVSKLSKKAQKVLVKKIRPKRQSKALSRT